MANSIFLRSKNQAIAGPVPSTFFDVDPNESQTIPDVKTAVRNGYRRAVEATRGNANRKTKASRPLDPDNEVRIGYTRLTVPPSKITIDERRLNTVFPGLRTNSPALVKTGRGSVLIGMDIIFPTRNSANEEMRELVAQFRSIPIIPLESQYVVNALVKKSIDHDENIIGQNVRQSAQADVNLTVSFSQWLSSLENISDYIIDNDFPKSEKRTKPLKSMVKEGREWNERFNGIQPDPSDTSISRFDSKSITKINSFLLRGNLAVTAAVLGNKGADLKESESIDLDEDEAGFDTGMLALINFAQTKEHNLRVAIEDKISSSQNINAVLRSDLSDAVQSIPVALKSMDVSPVQDHIDAFQMHLEVYVFNIAAYSIFPGFLSNDGNITTDFLRTDWLREWMNDRYLNGDTEARKPHRLARLKRPPDESSFIEFQYPTTEVSVLKDQGFSLAESNLNTTEPESVDPDLGTGFVHGGIRYIAKYQKLKIDHDNQFVRFETFRLHAENKLAVQPVLGTLYPTYQHMGRANAVVTMSFIISGAGTGTESLETATANHDDWIRRFNTMKREVDSVALNHGPGIRRRAFVNIDHEALGLLGVKSVYLDDSSIETIGPATSRITLRVIEFLHDQDSVEKISRVSTDNLFSRDLKLYAITNKINDNLLNLASDIDDILIDKLRGSVYGQENTYFSSSRQVVTAPNAAIITPRLLARVFQLRPRLLNRLWQQISTNSEFLDLDSEEADKLEGRIFGHQQRSLIADSMIRNWAINGLNEAFYVDFIVLQFSSLPVRLTPKPDLGMIKALIAVLDAEPDAFAEENKRLDALLNDEYMTAIAGIKTLQETRDSNQPQSSYPDLFLPTYGEAFSLLLENFNRTVENQGDTNLVQITDLDSLNKAAHASPDVHNLMKNVFPTYRELGKIPPYGTWGTDAFAKGPEDIVDPDFYWAKQSSIDPASVSQISDLLNKNTSPDARPKTTSKTANKKFSDDVARAGGFVLPNEVIPTFRNFLRSRNNGELKLLSHSLSKAFETDSTGEHVLFESVHSISGASDAEMPTEAKELGHPETARQLLETTIATQRDDQWRMSRAYPTVRLLLIKPSRNVGTRGSKSVEIFADELFGYNALQSVRITRHKFYPDVAEIELINVTGNLDPQNSLAAGFRKRSSEEIAGMALQTGNFDPVDRSQRTLREDPVPDRKQGESASSFAKRIGNKVQSSEKVSAQPFFIQEGMMIQIRMGYDGSVKDLPVVFNGQIAEVQYGDVIRMVAQSHASELTTPVNFYADHKESTFVHAAFVTMAQSPAAHYGPAPTIKEQGGLKSLMSNALGNDSVIVSESSLDTRRLENLFIPKQSWSLGREFAIPMISGLEVLHEISRLIPGFVCLADVPYGTRQTAYLGFTSQYYFAFPEDEVQEEVIRWNRDLLLSKIPIQKNRDVILRLVVNYSNTDFKGRLDEELVLTRSLLTRSFPLKRLDKFLGGRENTRLAFGYLAWLDSDDAESKGVHPVARMYGWDQVLEAILMDNPPQDEDDFNSQVAGVLNRGQGISTSAAQIGDISKLFEGGNPSSASAKRKYADSFTLTEDDAESIEDLLEDDATDIRIALFEFILFLQNQAAAIPTSTLQQGAEKRTGIMRHPRMRPFRKHHYANSLNHIIANQIYATRDEMANVIHMRHPEDVEVSDEDWDEVPIQIDTSTDWSTLRMALDRRIPPEDQKHRVVTENNVDADDEGHAHKVAYSNLAQAIRPMYRGELILRGNPEIKPYDLVWIDDKYNGISGPVDVESITHHFTNEFGFVTSVTPHAVVFPNVYSDYSQARASGLFTFFAIAIPTVAATIGVFLIPGVGLPLGSALLSVILPAGSVIGANLVGKEVGEDNSFFDLFTGDLQTETDKKPVSIIPLQLRGAPWTAGMIGVKSWNRYRVSDDQKDRFQSRGMNIRWDDFLGISKPEEDYFRNFK